MSVVSLWNACLIGTFYSIFVSRVSSQYRLHCADSLSVVVSYCRSYLSAIAISVKLAVNSSMCSGLAA